MLLTEEDWVQVEVSMERAKRGYAREEDTRLCALAHSTDSERYRELKHSVDARVHEDMRRGIG